MTESALPVRAYSRAVLIGTSTFQHAESLPWLPAVNNNVTDLAAALTDAETGVLDLDHCTTVYTPDSPRSLLGQLRPVAKQAEDLLIVYYAGHGLRDLNRDLLYLAVRETDPEELDGTAVPYESLREIVAASPARTKLLILDCCYSGMAIGRMSSGGVESDEVAVRGTSVITSSPRNKKALSPPGERHTAFTAEVLSLLKNGPRIPGRQLDAAELFRSVTAAMARRGLPEPKMSTVDTAGMVVLRRAVAAPSTRVAEAETAEATSGAVEAKAASDAVAAEAEAADEPEVSSGGEAVSAAARRWPGFKPQVLTWVLWVVFVLSSAFGAGGVAGALFARGSDLGTGVAMLVFAAGCAWSIRRRLRMTLAQLGYEPTFTQAYPVLAYLTRWVRTALLVLGTGTGLGLAITAVISPVPGTDRLSSVTMTVGMIVLMLEIAAGCGWALYRRVSGRGSARR